MKFVVTADTFWAKIYIAGPIEIAKQTCRKYCFEKGFCVTVDPTTYIYAGGEEAGVVVGIISYPRFPSTFEELNQHARNLGELLVKDLYQTSFTIMTPSQTTFYTNRNEN